MSKSVNMNILQLGNAHDLLNMMRLSINKVFTHLAIPNLSVPNKGEESILQLLPNFFECLPDI